MLKKAFLLHAILLQLALAGAWSQSGRPNVLVIFSDDHTEQTISAYGSRFMHTPNIDRIAREGVLLSNVFVTNSICAPSRAVLLTGKYSHVNGLRDNGPRRYFAPEQQQIQKIFSQNGYQTAWVGKWHLHTLPNGFDHWKILPDQGNYFQPDFIHMNNDTVRHKGYVTDLISDFALEWLEGRDASKPFFIVVGEKATHRNWMPDPKDFAEFEGKEFPYPDDFFDRYDGRRAAYEQDMTISKTMLMHDDLKIGVNYQRPGKGMFARMDAEQKKAYKAYYDRAELEYNTVKDDSIALMKWKYQRYMRDYLATARSMDRNIGRILDYLDQTGLSRNTIVIYTSDQGFYMGEHGWFDKRFMYEQSLRTPFVIRYPGNIPAGKRVDQMVVNIDFAPTLLDMAGIRVPSDMQGESFSRLAKGESIPNWRNSMYYHYYEYPEPHRVAPHLGIRTDRYKLIRFYGPHDAWELFDLKTDKNELNNLYADPSQSALIASLKKELRLLAQRYNDNEAVDLLNQE